MLHRQEPSLTSINKSNLDADAPIEVDIAYAAIASEYYDAALHPTCAAFDAASFGLLEDYFSVKTLIGALVCDVGAGISQVAKLLGNRVSELDALWLIDASREMLTWSDQFIYPNIRRRIAAAENLHLLGIQFDFVVASLGDPYNTSAFWHAVESSLSPDGICIFTTPSYEWASSFRRAESNEVADKALFVLADGSAHYVPSFINSPFNQSRLLRANSLEISATKHATIERLRSVPPKLSHLDAMTPVVTLYEIRKVGSQN
jgi:2-polyprenyl-3-methyl-5-hydroxy-6-metoxy-1,4-benzoquinol methylase